MINKSELAKELGIEFYNLNSAMVSIRQTLTKTVINRKVYFDDDSANIIREYFAAIAKVKAIRGVK